LGDSIFPVIMAFDSAAMADSKGPEGNVSGRYRLCGLKQGTWSTQSPQRNHSSKERENGAIWPRNLQLMLASQRSPDWNRGIAGGSTEAGTGSKGPHGHV
jgi:hypothetical protein